MLNCRLVNRPTSISSLNIAAMAAVPPVPSSIVHEGAVTLRTCKRHHRGMFELVLMLLPVKNSASVRAEPSRLEMHLWHRCPTVRTSGDICHSRLNVCLMAIDERLYGGHGDFQLTADIHIPNSLAMQIDDLTFDVLVHLNSPFLRALTITHSEKEKKQADCGL